MSVNGLPVAMITGENSGIGFATARKFASIHIRLVRDVTLTNYPIYLPLVIARQISSPPLALQFDNQLIELERLITGNFNQT